MGLSINVMKCPECGAELEYEEEREKMFCSFCGAPIVIKNDNEYVTRHVDNAKVLQAENERLRILSQLEKEKQEEQRKTDLKNRKKKIRKYGSIICVALMIIPEVIFFICEKLEIELDGLSNFILVMLMINGVLWLLVILLGILNDVLVVFNSDS